MSCVRTYSPGWVIVVQPLTCVGAPAAGAAVDDREADRQHAGEDDCQHRDDDSGSIPRRRVVSGVDSGVHGRALPYVVSRNPTLVV